MDRLTDNLDITIIVESAVKQHTNKQIGEPILMSANIESAHPKL